MSTRVVTSGASAPLGATVRPGGVNFSVFSKGAVLVELLLFDDANAIQPARVIPLKAGEHRIHHYWHVFVPDLQPSQVYAYRAHGPLAPEQGSRFDAEKVLLDPYGLVVAVPERYDRWAAARPGDNAAAAMKSVVADPDRYDWEDDLPLNRPFAETVIYELHVAGFTRHPSSGVPTNKRGTYAGLIQKIPYLKDLGITAVELLPVFQFDAQDCPPGKTNYWGYAPISFFAPHQGYSSQKHSLAVLDEFRDMVKAFHRAGLEVILDVVFNHTTEGGLTGPTLCYRGLANDVYYILEKDKSRYADYTGCGNTLNANQPIVRRLIQDSLRYWVTQMHVDGFRFDLASILSRDEEGRPLPNPPVLWDIESDPWLAVTKLIAEAWDAAGLYQVGSFIGDRWQEWNGRFRDDVRRFQKGDNGSVSGVAALLRRARIEWHGVALKRPDWSDQSHSLAFTLRTLRARFLLHGMLNAYWEPLKFELPPVPADRQQRWRRCIDTALDSPDDICPWETAPVVTQATYVAQPRSVVLLALALEGSAGSVPEVE
jgi:isoamylase